MSKPTITRESGSRGLKITDVVNSQQQTHQDDTSLELIVQKLTNQDLRTPEEAAVKPKWISTYDKLSKKPEEWLGSPNAKKEMKAISISPIFDGSYSDSKKSPWAEFLVDQGEDSEYLENCEHDDDCYHLHHNSTIT